MGSAFHCINFLAKSISLALFVAMKDESETRPTDRCHADNADCHSFPKGVPVDEPNHQYQARGKEYA